MSKYRNDWITVDGIKFQSKDEAKYYEYLKGLKAKDKILNFELQPKYELISKFKKCGKSYRATTYTPDFLIYHLDGSEELIDVKSLGTATQQGELRRKMFDYKYPELMLTWVCRNKKYGDADGWIIYEELKKIYSKRKKEKGE